jgi:hypothetical protein
MFYAIFDRLNPLFIVVGVDPPRLNCQKISKNVKNDEKTTPPQKGQN